MFKSIDYKLYLYLVLLIIAVSLSVFFILSKAYIYGVLAVFFVLFCILKLHSNYKKYNKNILFLLNALDNGDYSFHFTEAKLSSREKELNQMMNRIKDILSKAKQEVIEKEKFLSVIIENLGVGIIILDAKNNVRNTNKASLNLLGLSVFTHLNQLGNIDAHFPDLFRNLKIKNDNKQIKIVRERDVVQISLSVSEIKIQDEKLRIIALNNIANELDKEEVESWIKLIRVMTHEIMNSISPITSLSEMLITMHEQEQKVDPEQLRDSLTTINATAKGLASFVESYRQFSGVSQPNLRPIPLCSFIEAIINLEKAEIEAHNIVVAIQSDDESIQILGDETQLTRVILNLLKNAIEALEETTNKVIKIKIDSQNSSKVKISISNNGTPIPKNIIDNIFIPFFTTKTTGSGIGLSVSRYIARLHEGNLTHFYENGWTTFSLTLNKLQA